MVFAKESPSCHQPENVEKPSLTFRLLRVGLGLLVIILAESIIEAYAQFWSAHYDSIPLDMLADDSDIVNALLLTMAALIASLIAFPLIGWLAVVQQSKLLANYFTTMSIAWAAYVVWAIGGLPATHVTFVSSLAVTSVSYSLALNKKPVHQKVI
ncbi:hypothetical protein HDE_01497 [Halotydeus destructor]|nr:hypothetical protein HDE_01497 [Halotydeus destructor]